MIAQKPTIKQLNDKIKVLVNAAKQLNKDIDETNKTAARQMKDNEEKAGKSFKKLDKLRANMAKTEKEVEDELDAMILARAEDASQNS